MLKASDPNNELIISILSACVQAESESSIQNIKIGIKKEFINRTSEFYNRPCYGYRRDKKWKSQNNLAASTGGTKNIRLLFRRCKHAANN